MRRRGLADTRRQGGEAVTQCLPMEVGKQGSKEVGKQRSREVGKQGGGKAGKRGSGEVGKQGRREVEKWESFPKNLVPLLAFNSSLQLTI